MTKPRIKLPESAKAGEVIVIKTVATHPMETGNRRDAEGRVIARNIIHTFIATFENREVFRAELGSGISANPFLSFSMLVSRPGTFTFSWIDDDGQTLTETESLKVVG